MMGVNLDGVSFGTRYAIGAMKKTCGGSIVNMSLIEGMVGDRRIAACDYSKGGVPILSKSAALYCVKASYQIRINSLHPDFIDTPMVTGFVKTQGGDESAARKELEMLYPIGQLGEPNDVAYAVLYRASDEPKFVTGSDLSSIAALPSNEEVFYRVGAIALSLVLTFLFRETGAVRRPARWCGTIAGSSI